MNPQQVSSSIQDLLHPTESLPFNSSSVKKLIPTENYFNQAPSMTHPSSIVQSADQDLSLIHASVAHLDYSRIKGSTTQPLSTSKTHKQPGTQDSKAPPSIIKSDPYLLHNPSTIKNANHPHPSLIPKTIQSIDHEESQDYQDERRTPFVGPKMTLYERAERNQSFIHTEPQKAFSFGIESQRSHDILSHESQSTPCFVPVSSSGRADSPKKQHSVDSSVENDGAGASTRNMETVARVLERVVEKLDKISKVVQATSANNQKLADSISKTNEKLTTSISENNKNLAEALSSITVSLVDNNKNFISALSHIANAEKKSL